MSILKKEELARCYYEKLSLFGAMEYYSLKEEKTEDLVMKTLEQAVDSLLSGENGKEAEKALLKARQELIARTDILTAYTDCLKIYQYVLNRIELRFSEKIEKIDEEVFLQKVMEYIFNSKDNVVINERIKEVIGQLPVRMTKGKYFERLENSLSVYQGADVSAMESMLYLLRTGSMLYRPEKEGQYYKEYQEAVDMIKGLDFSGMTEEGHKRAERLLEETAEGLMREMDKCIFLIEAVNHFYGVFLLEQNGLNPEIKKLLKAVWQEEFAEAEKGLERLEGRQEQLLEKEKYLERGLFEAQIGEPGVKELLMAQALGSDSLFMEFDFEKEETTADQKTVEEAKAALTAELKKLFSENSMLINRAIMANTLNKLPVFFESSKEVAEYIQSSLEQCHDMAEKTMSMKLIYHIMKER